MIQTNPSPLVAAAIATHRRDTELSRLLAALQKSEPPLAGGIHVADNASSGETRAVCSAFPGVTWLPRPINNGPGPAWNAAIASAWGNPEVTHVLVLDDDVVPPPDTVRRLLAAMQTSGAGVAAPLLFDQSEHLWGFPEPREKILRSIIRRTTTPAECRRAFGDEPHPFSWATGACLLYARSALESRGLFREDFWMLGEDLELSMRVAAENGGVFTAQCAVPHLPPPPDPSKARLSHRCKFLALLQNLSYLAFHSPHCAHLKCYLAGNFKRYALSEGCMPGNLWDAWCAFYQGALAKQPAGMPSGARLRERAARRLRNS